MAVQNLSYAAFSSKDSHSLVRAFINPPHPKSKGRVRAEDLEIKGHFAEMTQRILAFVAVQVALQIEIKQVLPRLPVYGA
jgi:hypothetical protein